MKFQMFLVEPDRSTLSRDLRPGDFWWRDKGWKKGSPKSAKLCIVVPPSPGLQAKYEIHWAPCSVDGGKTAEDRLWDGDCLKPTVAGSWGIDHFHCWVNKGILTTQI